MVSIKVNKSGLKDYSGQLGRRRLRKHISLTDYDSVACDLVLMLQWIHDRDDMTIIAESIENYMN